MFKMLPSYLLSFFRQIVRNKVFSILNLLGLSVGMAAFMLLLQFVVYENSFDEFHEHSDRIYRIRYDSYLEGEKMFACAAAVPAVGPAMKNNFPEVLEYSWALPWSGVVTTDENISYRERKIQVATPSFLTMFSWEMIAGDTSALTKPYAAVLTESTARKYFGDEDPIGRILKTLQDQSFEVRGIIKDVPDNSHIKFTVLISAETLHQMTDNQSRTAWGWYDFNTYVLLEQETDPMNFQEKFATWLAEEKKEEWEENNSRQEFILQSIEDIHLHSDLLQESEPEENGDGDSVMILIIIALSVLGIAWINYINLSSSRALERAREVGIRKVVGGQHRQLVVQFLTESLMMNILAAGISLIILILCLPYFNQLTERSLSLSLFQEPLFWAGLVGLLLTGAILAGLYPAFVLSSFKPVLVLKGKYSENGKGFLMRKILVVFQFSASIALIAGTFLIHSQLRYMRNMDLGVDIEQKLVLRGPGVVIDTTFAEIFRTFKTEVNRIPGIEQLTASTNIPGDEIFWASGIRRVDEDNTRGVIYVIGMDEDYLPAFDIELLTGRNFSPEYGTEDLAIILNESATKFLGYETPEAAIGQKMNFHDEERHVVGVIADYHQMSLKQEPIPLLYLYLPANRSYFAMKVDPKQVDASMEELEGIWDKFFEGNPLDIFFLDDFYDRQYRIERQLNISVGFFALIAILIATLGLFGLSSFTTLQRTKEIGIRKVNGASSGRILYLLSRDYLELILLSVVIACPITWFFIRKWLESYPYRVPVHWWVFLFTGILALIVALAAVSIQTLRAANNNPTESLKYE
jgi:putative ABC transport system permease protein